MATATAAVEKSAAETPLPSKQAGDTPLSHKQVEMIDLEVRWKHLEIELGGGQDEEAGGDSAAADAEPAEETAAAENAGTDDASTTTSKTAKQEPTIVDINPEDDELMMFRMPQDKSFSMDLAHIRPNINVSVHPLTLEELYHPTVVKCMSSPDCKQFKLHYYRPPQDDQQQPKGLLVLYYNSVATATSEAATLKEIRSDISVQLSTPNTRSAQMQQKWTSDSKACDMEYIQNRTLYITNVGFTASVEQIKKVLPGAEHIVIACERTDKNKKNRGKPKGCAYAVYTSSAEAENAYKLYSKDRPQMKDRVLGVYQYRPPVNMPKGLLSLNNRRLVLKHGSKAAGFVTKITNGEEIKNPDLWRKKLKVCLELIEKDNEARRSLGMSTPSFKQITSMKSLPTPDSKRTQKMLESLGIIDPPQRPRVVARVAPQQQQQQQQSNIKSMMKNQTKQFKAAVIASKRYKENLVNGPYMRERGRGSSMSAPYAMGYAKGMMEGAPGHYGNGMLGRGAGLYGGQGQYAGTQDLANSVGMLMDLSYKLMNQFDQGNAQQRSYQQRVGPLGGNRRVQPGLPAGNNMLPTSSSQLIYNTPYHQGVGGGMGRSGSKSLYDPYSGPDRSRSVGDYWNTRDVNTFHSGQHYY